MKKFLLLFILLLNGIAFGQNVEGDSHYKFTVNGYVGLSNSDCGTNIRAALQWITLRKEDNTYETVVQGTEAYPHNGHGLINTNFSGETSFNKNNKPIEILYRTVNRQRRGFPRTCRTVQNGNSTRNITTPYEEVNYDFSGLNQPGNSVEKIEAIVTLNTPDENNRLITEDKYLNIQLTDNIDNEHYNWEYSVGSPDNFVRIPDQYNNQPTLNLKGEDFLTDNDFGKSIFIRVNTGFQNNTSNIILFSYIKIAPKITSASVEDIKCFGEENGQVTLNFDRMLLEGETLEGSLVNTANGGVVGNYNFSDLAASTATTITGLAAGNYKIDVIGTYKENATYTEGSGYSYSFTIKEPKAVEFSLTQSTNVFCYDGSDGIISLVATGEAGRTFQYSILGANFTTENWVDFSSANSTKIENLPAGEYTIKVMDSSGCLAKDGNTIKEISVTIKQPDAPLSLVENEISIEEPSGFGLSNGLIAVRIVGGTPNDDGRYNFEWRKDSPTGEIIPASQIVTDAMNNPFTIVLKDIPSGKYYLTIQDKNYALALNGQEGCTIITREFIVEEPLPLIVGLSVKEEILCHIENEFIGNYDRDGNLIPDQAENGKIQSTVTGGIGAYTYQWYKNENGNYTLFQNENASELQKIIAGTYQLEVTDANNNKSEAELVIESPARLIVNVDANELICHSDNGGIITATASGGVGNYTYLWSTSDTTNTVTGLTAGNYFVTIRDNNNCVATNSVTIKEPSSFEVETLQQINPSCFGAANGQIELNISGGTAPYLIEWSNGMQGAIIIGLVAGTYTVTITDESGCQTIKTYTLTEPAQTKVDLGKDITLCLGDTMEYDVTIDDPHATYQWLDQDGRIISSSPKITLSLAGEYTVRVITGAGCVATDSVVIHSSFAVLQPEFLITTHAFVEANVKLVKSSRIVPERVEWIFPSSHDFRIINETNENLEIKFSKTGKYVFGLKGYQGLCEKTFYKEVLVEENINGIEINPQVISNIKEFIVTPNPNNGDYKVLVKLHEARPIRIRIVDMLSQQLYVSSEFEQNTAFEIPFHQYLTAGTYFVILETANEMQVRRMLIK